MPSSPLQHLLKLLQKVQEGNWSNGDGLSHASSVPSLQSLGDGIRFLEKFKERPAGPIARSTPHTSPSKNETSSQQTKVPDRRLSFSMPDLHRLSPIKDKLDGGNATGPNGPVASSKKRRIK